MSSSARFVGFARVLVLCLVLVFIVGEPLSVAFAHARTPDGTQPLFGRGTPSMGGQSHEPQQSGVPVAQVHVFATYTNYTTYDQFISNRVDYAVINDSRFAATRLRVLANDMVIYDGPFVGDALRTMRLSATLQDTSACTPVVFAATLFNNKGASNVSTQTVILDNAVQTSGTVTPPRLRPFMPGNNGPRASFDPLYLATDIVLVSVGAEAAGCSGINAFTLVYDAVPSGPLPADTTRNALPGHVDIDMEIPITGQEQDPIVAGVYEFHMFLTDNVGNRTRVPAGDGRLRLIIDREAPTARIDPAVPLPDPPIVTRTHLVDLTNLHVTDDMYPDQGNGQPYWGYWLLTEWASDYPPTSSSPWDSQGVIIPGHQRVFLYNVPLVDEFVPPQGYTVWMRVLDGAGNASAPFVAPMSAVPDLQRVYAPLVVR